MPAAYKSLLFVPGARPDRFGKAAASGADTMIIDLEDAVLPDAKTEARTAALAWLTNRGEVRAGIRINSPRTAEGCADIAALAGFDIAKQSQAGVLVGGADYSASLGADLSNWDAMIVARGTIAGACGAAGVPAYDVPFLDVKDAAGLDATTRQAKAMGFAGRACIHPRQVETVNAAFQPTPAEILDAKALIKALEESQGGAALHNRKLIDSPIIQAAEKTLAKDGEKRG